MQLSYTKISIYWNLLCKIAWIGGKSKNISTESWKTHQENQLETKIILHRIISVVWLTNFLSEIRSLSPHDDETQLHVLSVILVLDLESETADDRLQRLQPLQWMWSSLSGLSKKKWIKASLGSHGRNKIILNWYPSHTEIFSKRRKIYAVWVKDLSYDCGAFELVTTLANLAKSLWTTFKVGLGFRELA